MGEVRIKNTEIDAPKRRVAPALLRPVFGLLLLIPVVRRARRGPAWKWVRAAGWAAGAALLVAGAGRPATTWAGVVLAALATMWGPAEDPDAMQKLAARLGARHVINGGTLAAGGGELKPGIGVVLLVTPEEALVAGAQKPEDVKLRFALAAIEGLAVEGEEYRPHYVSFAKAPPVREQHPDRNAKCRLAIRFVGEGGAPGRLDLEYRGTFARHLAEIAAHTLYECRNAALAGGPGAAEFLRVNP